ncbi:MAG: hypothetical protein JSV16_05230 [Candidatus Hydrogenedentota bacterium]|nr:MAG: hypothetical protein JSV16_05230 [Candidatus Hydrogenedentota bacterium]
MTKVLHIFLWYVFSVSFVLLSAPPFIGKPVLLKYSAKLKPYGMIFQTVPEIRGARSSSDEIILFFGDSSVVQPPWAKKDTPHIPALLQTELQQNHPEVGKVSLIEWAFGGARLFHYYCLLFEAEKCSPALLIIPINWRSLGPRSVEWSELFAFHELSALVPFSERVNRYGDSPLHLEGISLTRHVKYSLSQRPLLYLSGLKLWARTTFGIEPEQESLSDPPGELPSAKELIGQFSDEKLFAQYANELAPNNLQLRVLRSLVETSARRGIKLLFYITPIHVDEMRQRKLFQPTKFRNSVERVVESATSETSMCLNLVSLLGEEDFIDYFEHYSLEGNQKIARALAPMIPELLKSPPPPQHTSTAFLRGSRR